MVEGQMCDRNDFPLNFIWAGCGKGTKNNRRGIKWLKVEYVKEIIPCSILVELFH